MQSEFDQSERRWNHSGASLSCMGSLQEYVYAFTRGGEVVVAGFSLKPRSLLFTLTEDLGLHIMIPYRSSIC